ncbi:MAG: hypothetical protein KGL15_00660 [Acidobacteriota bacterium]|nr:hypothetical protein [Acidobacteriota bacterium]
MTSDDKPQKISIGFHGGQTLVARVRAAELARLREQLAKSTQTGTPRSLHDLSAEDGIVTLDLMRVDYVLVDSEDHRVGF